jgi:hypothetical protein
MIRDIGSLRGDRGLGGIGLLMVVWMVRARMALRAQCIGVTQHRRRVCVARGIVLVGGGAKGRLLIARVLLIAGRKLLGKHVLITDDHLT